ncbi:MAG TPA: Crp/Fnr family transcriptional regulator [Clostridia bacterium]|nr:Crp/Fnr family transcriptional regulator [Clostridia bacterium]
MFANECIDFTDLFVKHFCFWEHLSEEEKRILCENMTMMKFKKGENIHNANENCLGVILIKKGHLRTYMMSEDGRDITLFRLFEDDVCVLSASCIIDTITFDIFIDAEEDSELLLIKSDIFEKLAEKNIYIKNFQHEITSTRFSDVMWTMQQILFMSFDRRLAIFLMDEIAKNGKDEIKLTHEQIARYMGSAREVVTRMLKYFVGEGIVELSRGGVKIIDKNKLRELAQ